jgi:hypothetical protein
MPSLGLQVQRSAAVQPQSHGLAIMKLTVTSAYGMACKTVAVPSIIKELVSDEYNELVGSPILCSVH